MASPTKKKKKEEKRKKEKVSLLFHVRSNLLTHKIYTNTSGKSLERRDEVPESTSGNARAKIQSAAPGEILDAATVTGAAAHRPRRRSELLRASL